MSNLIKTWVNHTKWEKLNILGFGVNFIIFIVTCPLSFHCYAFFFFTKCAGIFYDGWKNGFWNVWYAAHDALSTRFVVTNFFPRSLEMKNTRQVFTLVFYLQQITIAFLRSTIAETIIIEFCRFLFNRNFHWCLTIPDVGKYFEIVYCPIVIIFHSWSWNLIEIFKFRSNWRYQVVINIYMNVTRMGGINELSRNTCTHEHNRDSRPFNGTKNVTYKIFFIIYFQPFFSVRIRLS